MSILAAVPIPSKDVGLGTILTFVVPAPNGCNYNCSFCFIARRGEAQPDVSLLTKSDYVRFLDDVCKETSVDLVCIQGYEPLLPESFPYTEALLAHAQQKHVPTALVTNGSHLARYAMDLRRLGVQSVAVSLDDPAPEVHDRIRGAGGAFAAAIKGIKALQEVGLGKTIYVTSVLRPAGTGCLDRMPELLTQLDVQHWSINPLLAVGNFSRIAGKPMDLLRQLEHLVTLCADTGIQIHVDDEFSLLLYQQRDQDRLDQLPTRRLRRPSGLVRLSPSGACAVGTDILKPTAHVPVWNKASAVQFLQTHYPEFFRI